MIYIIHIFSLLNIVLVTLSKLDMLHYVAFLEGVITIIYIFRLSPDNLFYPLNKKVKVTYKDMKSIKKILSVSAITFIIPGVLYIIKLMPNNTEVIFLVSIPMIESVLLLNKLRKSLSLND